MTQTQAQLDKRMAMERDVVAKLIQTAIAAGWTLRGVDDGEEFIATDTEAEAMEHVFSVDESTIFFKKLIDGKKIGCSCFIVLGNDGWDCIADHSVQAAFNAEVTDVMDAYTDALCEAI